MTEAGLKEHYPSVDGTGERPAGVLVRARTGRQVLDPSTASLAVLVGAFAAGGCGLIDAGDCTGEARPAIVLAIVDIVTGVSPLVPSVITVTDGPFMERYPPAGVVGVVLPKYWFALERAGRYSILVETPGYLNWSTSNIQVRGLPGLQGNRYL